MTRVSQRDAGTALRRYWLLGSLLAAAGCNEKLEVLSYDATATPEAGASADAGLQGCAACGGETLCIAGRCKAIVSIGELGLGASHTCAVMAGRLSCWGSNDLGQLGTGDNESHLQPQSVGNDMDWFMVSAGAHHTCGLRDPGTLFCWGDNSVGQLASERTRSRTPSQIVSFNDWTDVRCGGDNCCARRNGGQLFCWGGNQDGSVGSGQAGKVPSPTQISPDNGFLPGFSVGIGHACAIWSDRELACWGRNAEGQLGIGRSRPNQRNPAQVQPGMNIEWSSVAVGQEHTCGVRLDGRLSCWGGNIDAELGVVLDEPDGVASKTDLPVLVDNNNDWVAIAAGAFYTCGIRRSQDLFCWGRGSLGQLGLGVKERVELPARVGTNDWIRVGLGVTHSCGIDVHRQVYCWGDNTAGQLGTGDTQQRAEPMRVPL